MTRTDPPDPAACPPSSVSDPLLSTSISRGLPPLRHRPQPRTASRSSELGFIFGKDYQSAAPASQDSGLAHLDESFDGSLTRSLSRSLSRLSGLTGEGRQSAVETPPGHPEAFNGTLFARECRAPKRVRASANAGGRCAPIRGPVWAEPE